VPEKRVLGSRGLSSGLGPGIEVGREVRESLRLKVEQNEELVVEDGLQASGGVKVVRLEVNSTRKGDRRILWNLIG
jgi:hypothetical protein